MLIMSYSAVDHTFVICAYGESPYLRECMESVRAQDMDTNVILSTSTPNDYIYSLCGEFDIPLFTNEGEPGIGKDWNRALSHVETRLATIAHQDDVYLPRYSSALINGFNNAELPLLFFCDYGEMRNGENIDSSRLLQVKRFMLAPLKNKRRWSDIALRRFLLSFGSPISCPSVSFNLEALPIPLFNTEMKCSLDWDAWERISKMEGDFVYEPSIQMRHRIHGDSETSHLIENQTRTTEDYEMFKRFWPNFAAALIAKVYAQSQKSNNII